MEYELSWKERARKAEAELAALEKLIRMSIEWWLDEHGKEAGPAPGWVFAMRGYLDNADPQDAADEDQPDGYEGPLIETESTVHPTGDNSSDGVAPPRQEGPSASTKIQTVLSADEDTPGEHCQVCRREYTIVYSVPDDVWRKITPKAGEAGLLCPECADRRARGQGIHLMWRARRESTGEDTPEPDWNFFEQERMSEWESDSTLAHTLLWLRSQVMALGLTVDQHVKSINENRDRIKTLEDTLADVQAEVIALKGMGA